MPNTAAALVDDAFLNDAPSLPVLWTERASAAAWLNALNGQVDGWVRQRAALAVAPQGASEEVRAEAAIHRACVHSAVLGGVTGAVSTAVVAAVVSVGPAAIPAAAPVAAAAAGAEVLLRAGVHAELAASIAQALGAPLELTQPCDVARLRELTSAEETVSGEGWILADVIKASGSGLMGAAGNAGSKSRRLRGIVPVLGIVTASLGAWRETRKLGEEIHRRLRVQRERLAWCLATAAECGEDGDLFIEGMWFLGTATGPMTADGHAVLGEVLKSRDVVSRGAILRRLTDDERDWLGRLARVPGASRPLLRQAVEGLTRRLDPSVPMGRIARRAVEALS